MTKSFFFFTVTITFVTVAILHFLRLTFELDVSIGSWSIPGWFSGIIIIFSVFMAYWSLKINRKKEQDEKGETKEER